MDPLVGKTFADRYLIEERLGSGAMGDVYRAKHVKIGKSFAVKVLRAELLAKPKVRQRFDREAELAGTLKHPNIVGIVDVGETPEGVRYLVMELAVGDPLSTLIAQGPFPPERAIPLLRQLCDALHHAHDRGLVHRDFKPDNVIVERRRDGSEFPRIIDFGIAILRDDLSSGDSERLTTSGVVLGTPQYLAPEQAFGTGDHRIDLFALGVVAYEMLTGRLPFDGEGAEVARANLTMKTPPFGVRVPALVVDPLLEAFTLQLMSKSPELRPESGKEARELLDLIERDRDAAGELLGIDPSTSMRRMMIPPRTEESAPAQRVAIGDTHQSQPIARAGTDVGAPVSAIRAMTTAPPPRSKRWLLVGGVAVALAAGAIVVDATRSKTTEPVATVAPKPPEPKPPEPKPPEPKPPEPKPPEPAAPAPEPKPEPKPAPIKPKPITPKPKPTGPIWEAVDEMGPKELAALYVAVGRDLKTYADKKGANAESLSYRYRLIKISDALQTGDRRRAAAKELQAIRQQLK